jgi:hypothetical protein
MFTASNSEAYQHYIDTVENGFSLESVSKFLPTGDFNYLTKIYGNKPIRAWGALPGRGNETTWHTLQRGHPILIYRNKNFEYYAFVSYKLHDQDLAQHLWKVNHAGQTWEYAYFLDNLTEVSVPIDVFNRLIGYAQHWIPRGFHKIDDEKSQNLIGRFGSIEAFLNHLAEGKWVENDDKYPREVKKEIIQERIARQIGKTKLLEGNLENFLADRVDQIEGGLKLIERQLDTHEVGRLDLLCEDTRGNLVVVELKKFKAGPSIIDQIQRYMGWVIQHRAKPNQKVRGIVIVGSKDTTLEYAARANPLIEVKVFTVAFQ